MNTEFIATAPDAWPTIFHDFDERTTETIVINLGLNRNSFESILEEIELDFPRVAGNLKLLVGHLEFETAMNRLIVDNTGGRQGFPPRIMALLLKLSDLHTRKYGLLTVTNDPWHDATVVQK